MLTLSALVTCRHPSTHGTDIMHGCCSFSTVRYGAGSFLIDAANPFSFVGLHRPRCLIMVYDVAYILHGVAKCLVHIFMIF